MMSGWIKLHRSLSDHHLFRKKPERLAIWVHLLLSCAWRDTLHDVNGTSITVERGQYSTSYRRLADNVGVTEKVVRNALKRFRAEGMVELETGTGRLLITICNYDKYQDISSVKGTEGAHRRHITGAQMEEGKKLRKDRGSVRAARAREDEQFSDVEVRQAIEIWNTLAESWGLSKVDYLTEKRCCALRHCLDEFGGMETWQKAMKYVESSELLRGGSGEWTGCSFDWVTDENNYIKIIEGTYGEPSWFVFSN